MGFDALGDLNWLAVSVATLAYYVLGAVWFAEPTFGKAWRRSIGWEMAEGRHLGTAFYVGPLITCLVAAIAVAMFAGATGSDTFTEGIVLGLSAGVGIAGAVLFVVGVLDPVKPQPLTWFGITAGYHLLGLVISSVIVSVWT